MVTRLYLHQALNAISGTFPTTKQSTMTATDSMEAQTVNRSMNPTIGISQVTLQKSITFALSVQTFYCSKWISQALNQTSIAANTWTVNIAAMQVLVPPWWPDDKTGNGKNTLYVWRPSTGIKIATIFDGISATVSAEGGDTVESCNKQTYTGSAATCAVGDVLIFEYWANTTSDTAGAYSVSIFYDGTTVNTTDNAAVSNHATFIETPEAVSFSTGAGSPITATSTTKTLVNKFIRKF